MTDKLYVLIKLIELKPFVKINLAAILKCIYKLKVCIIFYLFE